MAYSFSRASNTMQIAEQEYGTNKEIRFTMFTSCIGLIARKDKQVTGVHLVIFSESGDIFDEAAAADAIKLLGKYDKVVVIGHIDIWAGQIPGYEALIRGLKSPVKMSEDDGIYGGRVTDAGDFQIYKDNKYVNVR